MSIDLSVIRKRLHNPVAFDATAAKTTEKSYLAAIYAEQVRTNELLEQLVRERATVD